MREQGAFVRELPADLRSFDGSPQRWRWKHLAGLSGRIAQHARFFCALEECSQIATILAHPGIPMDERKSRVAQLGLVVGLSLRRLDARARATWSRVRSSTRALARCWLRRMR